MAENLIKNIHNDLLHNPEVKGWHFGYGEPELWRFKDDLLVENGKVLDIGMGYGRASFFFAMYGMEVTGYDLSGYEVRLANRIARKYNLPIKAINKNIHTVDLPLNSYDMVVLGQTFVHFPAKKEAFKVLDKAVEATKPGGHIWVRALSKADDLYEELVKESSYHPAIKKDSDTFLKLCDCSGQLQYDPYLFFETTELMQYFLHKGLKIKHSQTMPQRGKQNIMFGEDWPIPECSWKTNGCITVLAQKI